MVSTIGSQISTLPLAVRIVAFSCIIYGLIFTVLSLMTLFTQHIDIDFSAVLFLFAGIGLLRRRRSWLVFLVWVCRAMVFVAVVVGIIAVLFPYLVNLNINGNTFTAAQSPLAAAAIIFAFIVIFGTLHWALTRADVQSAYRKTVPTGVDA
jgi:hypothetical protein